MMWWYGGGMPGWGSVLMMIGTGLFWAVIVLFAVAAALRLPRSGHGPDAEQLLAERFARGEIDEQEYRSRLGVLVGEQSAGRRSE
jgi:putative membrane protein